MVKILILFFIIVSGFFMFLLANQQHENSSETTEKITIGNAVGVPSLALIAEEKGYFKQQGLDVSFKEYETPMIKDLLDRKIDIVSSTAEFVVVRNSFGEENLKILAAVSEQRDQWEVVARKDKNIYSTQDLKGKKIAVQRGTAGEYFLAEFLIFHNLHMDDITVVDLELPQRIEQISHGELDAVIILSPYTQQLKKKLGENAISWTAQNETNAYGLSYTTEEFLAQRPQTAERYLRALIAAETFVNINEQEARTIMQKKLYFTNDEINDLWPLFTFKIGLEQELLLTMENQARWAIENKITDKKEVPDYLNTIYFEGLSKVKPEAITMIH